jgi:DNA-binding NtrC family response regulator
VQSLPRVLVIEENDLLRWSLTQYLAAEGETVHGIGELRELAAALAEPAGVIIFDLDLPRSTLRGWLRLIREGAPQAVLIATTAEGREEQEKDALAEGVAAVLRKPFDLASMRQLVRQCRDGRLAARQQISSGS